METVFGLAVVIGVGGLWVGMSGAPIGSRRELALLSTILGAFIAMGATLILPQSAALLDGIYIGLLVAFAATAFVTVQRRKRQLRAQRQKLQAQRQARITASGTEH